LFESASFHDVVTYVEGNKGVVAVHEEMNSFNKNETWEGFGKAAWR